MKKSLCPKCGSKKTCPIVYGYPADIEAFLEAEAKGEIVGGGCIVDENSPKWHCNECSNQWSEENEQD